MLKRRRKNPYKELESSIGYRFKNRELLATALMHRSFRFENTGVEADNQRLEFLGDAVLGLTAAAHLFDGFPEQPEGFLTKCRSEATCGRTLARIAKSIDLGRYLQMGKGEERSGGRKRRSNLADALEAVIGAAYIDGGMRAAQRIFDALFSNEFDGIDLGTPDHNPKGELQELCQRLWKEPPRYEVLGSEGPAHARVFTAQAHLPDGTAGRGRGASKQRAEADAAVAALEALREAGSRQNGVSN